MTAISTKLPRSPQAPGTARRLVEEHTRALTSRQRDDAALMVSELVTNAFLHGIGTISLRIEVDAEGVRVEVADEGQVAVAPGPTPGAHGGWGLGIVARLADDWGVVGGSTKVWFTLGRSPAER